MKYRKVKLIVLLIIAHMILKPVAIAQSKWSFEVHGGGAYNVPFPLTIHQANYADIRMTARFSSESFILPVYWDIRAGRWKNYRLWEFEVIHHKLYLENTTNEVQKFNISHGFNMLLLNRGFEQKLFRYRAGVGVVLAHPESLIRNKSFGDSTNDFDTGYFVTGPVLGISAGKPIHFTKSFHINLEAKTTLAYSHIKIAEGYADVFNVAFHLVMGLGFDFNSNSKGE